MESKSTRGHWGGEAALRAQDQMLWRQAGAVGCELLSLPWAQGAREGPLSADLGVRSLEDPSHADMGGPGPRGLATSP